MGQAVAPAPAANQVHYERRQPEETTLYQVVQDYFETCLAQLEFETGASSPDFVKDEFDAFLECGSWLRFHVSGAGFAPMKRALPAPARN
jgi:hypothetical protein